MTFRTKNNRKNQKVVIGLSGGVDSTAAALLLQERGYQVTGLYFDVRPPGPNPSAGSGDAKVLDGSGPSAESGGFAQAKEAARQLQIPLLYKNVGREFEELVIGNFCREYCGGRTPNPCVICNPGIKFQALLAAAEEIGAEHIATGHYADTFLEEKSGLWYIRMAANRAKDQSYMLYRLGQEVLSRLLLPLNRTEDKEAVRRLAREKALGNAEARDSQEICFLQEGEDYKAFLASRGFAMPEGDFVDQAGRVLGRHRGILHYTVGQRKGLGIALGKPAFVTEIRSETNQVVLGDHEDLFTDRVFSRENVLAGDPWEALAEGEPVSVTAKIRYAAQPAKAAVYRRSDGRLLTVFQEPQRAVTPGQSIVFYRGELVLGGGFIC